MPKILINEKDNTSPGAPGSYANYSVLITGFADASITNEKVQPDSNGVYEFSSAQDFKDTIGLVAPGYSATAESSTESSNTLYHYGNQMAYELLKMGYHVIYKPITKVKELANENTWEIFKDKASYDFRFITHGLLESSQSNDYDEKMAELTSLKPAVDEIKRIAKKVLEDASLETDEAKVEAANAEYDLIKANYAAFIDTAASDSEVDANGIYKDFKTAQNKVSFKEGLLTIEIEALKEYIITTSLINDANACIANLAMYKASGSNDTNDMDNSKNIPGRGDCIALIEVDENRYTDEINTNEKAENLIINAINEMTGIDDSNGKYCAMTVPSVIYKMSVDSSDDPFDGNKKFPGAFHYLACFINSLKLGFAEWYAAAGYTRGVSSYVVDHTTVKLGEIAINALEPRNYDDPQTDYPKFACNVIANFRGSYYLWGNRTAHPLGKKGNEKNGDLVASSFLNIRQLCTTIKKQLYVACRRFTFDPNSDTLWFNFVNAIRPTLEAMKADQGIRDYKVLKVFTDRKATLKAKIRIIPIEAVEDFDLEVSLEDSFGETAAVVTE